MRYLLAVLVVLAMTVEARSAPGSWTTEIHGADPTQPPAVAPAAGNANKMEVRAGTSVTYVNAFAITDPFSADQDGCAQAEADAWFTLKFCGSAQATDHTWEINTDVYGSGFIQTGANLAASARGESLELIEFSGDNSNGIAGRLAAHDSGAASFTFTFPPEFSATLGSTSAGPSNDVYRLNREKTTRGGGKVCRVRVSTYAKASVTAKCSLGASTVGLEGSTRGDLTMQGFCKVAGELVKDEFVLYDQDSKYTTSGMEKPSGGFVTDTGTPPPDTPTEEERRGETPPSEQESVPAGSQTETPVTPPAEEETSAPGTSSPDSGGATSPDSGGTTEGD